MNNYFFLTKEEQLQVLQAAETQTGIPSQVIEKDLWVTTILQIIFSLPFADKLIFKGGTSLSKVWKLINRFSEDIDLSVDRSLFGLEGDLTKKQIKKLRKESSTFIKETFYKELSETIYKFGIGHLCTIDCEPDGKSDSTYPEPRKIWIKYDSACKEELNYLKPVVLLEIGARSLLEPYENNVITSIVEELFPKIKTTLVNNHIPTAIAKKTFIEKIFLLHELFSIEGSGNKANRKSRHLYDIYMMKDKDFAIEALDDDELWENIRHHREIFTSVKGVDYSPGIRKRITIIPREDIKSAWEKDFSEMLESMIYGNNKPNFNEITKQLKKLQDKLRK